MIIYDKNGNGHFEETREEVRIEAADGCVIGRFCVTNEDPRFIYPLPLNDDNIPSINRGGYLIRESVLEPERRPILGVAISSSILGAAFIILAPHRVTTPNPTAAFHRHGARAHDGTATYVELRPGTVIWGGRGSGFYDSDGIVLEAQHTGGDPAKSEDWIFYVLGKSNYGQYAPQWITLNEVGGVMAGPTSILEFPLSMDKTVEEMLAVGEKELLAYFVRQPEKMNALHPAQFEILVGSIYKNLGFAVEHLGAWNQEDGGVDIIAVSRSSDFRLAIQCKTSKHTVSAKPIRELAGVLDAFRAHQGVVATTSHFTASARKEVEGSLWKVSLQDRDTLFKKMISVFLPNVPF